MLIDNIFGWENNAHNNKDNFQSHIKYLKVIYEIKVEMAYFMRKMRLEVGRKMEEPFEKWVCSMGILHFSENAIR